MRNESTFKAVFGRAALAAVLGITVMGAGAGAQTTDTSWRIGGATGAFAPLSSLIRTADAADTRISAGPAFTLEAQYQASSTVSVYLGGTAAFGTVRLGTSIRPDVVGPSDRAILLAGTGGVVLASADWLGSHIEPTIRVGGGFKWYGFDLTDAESQIRPTGDFGLGLRGIDMGPLDVGMEVRWLPSSFDQSRLPTRGIETQNQRQNDFMFTVGVGIRP